MLNFHTLYVYLHEPPAFRICDLVIFNCWQANRGDFTLYWWVTCRWGHWWWKHEQIMPLWCGKGWCLVCRFWVLYEIKHIHILVWSMSAPGGQHVSRLVGLIVIRLSLIRSSVAQLCLRCLSEIHLYRDRLWHCEIPYIGGVGQICQCITLRLHTCTHICVRGIPCPSYRKGIKCIFISSIHSCLIWLTEHSLNT